MAWLPRLLCQLYTLGFLKKEKKKRKKMKKTLVAAFAVSVAHRVYLRGLVSRIGHRV